MTDLKPCPNPRCECKSSPGLRAGALTRMAAHQYQGECRDCRIYGPACDTPEEATAAWNERPADPHCEALVAALEIISKRPTHEGGCYYNNRLSIFEARAALAAYRSAKP